MVIELASVEAPLALFVEGIAGRYFHIATTSEFAGRRFSLEPDRSAVTTDTLYLPERLDAPDPAAYRVLAAQQLGQQQFGSFEFEWAVAAARLPHLTPSAASLPGTRVSDLEQFYRCFDEPALASRLLHLCERLRIDALLQRHYPGLGRHIRRFHDHLLERQPPAPMLDAASLLHALECLVLGAEDHWLAALDTTGLWAPCAAVLAPLRAAPEDVYQSAVACADLLRILCPLLQRAPLEQPLLLAEELDGPASWLQRDARLDDWREELARLDQNLLAIDLALEHDTEAGSAEGLADGELRPEDAHLAALQQARDTLSRRLDMEGAAIRNALGTARPDARSYRYDEWDHLQRKYLSRWCRLFEQRLAADEPVPLAALQALIRRYRPRVQKQLELIRPLGYQRVFRVSDGDELDFNAVIQARQDRLAGQSPDDRVYSRRERVHRDVCTAFLVDLSASTDDPVETTPQTYPPDDDDEFPNLRDPYVPPAAPDSEAEPRRIIDVQREAMLIMAGALEGLGDRYGIYGFSGYGRDCVEFYVAKEPDERFSSATLSAITAMKPKRSTRMGPAIRHGTRKLIDSGSALKLLVILSDGFPQDSDYGPERGNHEYGVQDTARALQEAHEKGVETFCVTVDRSGHDYLRRMCPDARYMIIEDIDDLPLALSKVYRTLTA